MRGDNILEKAELKSAPFQVPEGYFDNLPARVASRVATDGKTGGRKVTIFRFWPVAAAACLAALAIGLWQLSLPDNPSYTASAEQEYLMEYLDLSEAQIADYTEETSTQITQDEIMEYLAYTDVSGAYIYDRMSEAE